MKINMSQEWLKSAKLDLETAKYIIGIHSQQAIEKSFKAIIEHKNEKIPKQHDLLKLKKLVDDILDIDNDDLLDSLNTLYIDSRYPGDMGLLPYGQPTIEDAKEFYHFSQEIFDEVSKIIG